MYMKRRLSFIIVIFGIIVIGLFLISSIKNKQNEKYFDWHVRFTIYDSAKNGPEGFPPDEIFEKEKNKILFFIPEKEYQNYNLTYTTNGRLRNGFSIETTQKGYNIIRTRGILMKILSKYISTISYQMVIDPSIQVNPNNESELVTCMQNRECIKVRGDCCGCSSGGTATSINRKYYDYWQNKFIEGCVCPAMISNHKTCRQEPKCIRNKCKLV